MNPAQTTEHQRFSHFFRFKPNELRQRRHTDERAAGGLGIPITFHLPDLLEVLRAKRQPKGRKQNNEDFRLAALERTITEQGRLK